MEPDMEPQAYITVDIIDEIVRRVEEDPHDESSVKAMTSTILSHYFTPGKGFGVTAASDRDDQRADLILRIRHFTHEACAFVDFGFVQADWRVNSKEKSQEKLQDALEILNTESKSCWAILVHGCEFYFYHYDPERLAKKRLTPWPHSDQHGSCFHARGDSMKIHHVLLHMAQEDKLQPTNPGSAHSAEGEGRD